LGLLGALAVPHPPLIVPEVGRGGEKAVRQTIDAYRTAARAAARLRPETVIVVSPHAPCYRDYIHISPGAAARGDFAAFGAAGIAVRAEYDEDFTAALTAAAEAKDLPAGTAGASGAELDHGTLIPLYFLNMFYQDYRLVRVGISALPAAAHYELGGLIRAVAERLDRRALFVASGDLSHRLLASGPYGYHPSGPLFDAWVTESIRSGQLENFLMPEEKICAEAGECGLRPLQMLAGALAGRSFTPSLLSYEGPFGVGYAVAAFLLEEEVNTIYE
jgi:aromatic ring-opening dioxygenase LigB subunit